MTQMPWFIPAPSGMKGSEESVLFSCIIFLWFLEKMPCWGEANDFVDLDYFHSSHCDFPFFSKFGA